MSYIYHGLGYVIGFFESFLGSYLLAMFLFALAVKILMFPFGIQQQKNQQKQASLRAKEMAIHKKYKGRENDRDAMMQRQNEIQQMYRDNNYNQFSGCLPMLIQLPIILVVYKAVINPLSYICHFAESVVEGIRTAIGTNFEFFQVAANTIKDGKFTGDELTMASILNNPEYLAKIGESVSEVTTAHIPNFTLFGYSLGGTPTGWFILIPFLVFGAQFLSMKLTRKLSYQPIGAENAGCSMKVMDFSMPAMTLVMSFFFPVILSFYWIFQSLLGVLQQWILKMIWPIKMPTEEDYRNAERAMRGKATSGGSGYAAPTGTRNYDPGKKYRSLHNIDAEEDETASPSLPAPEEPKNGKADGDAPKMKGENPNRNKGQKK